jgi:hypothetical protein
MSSNASFVPNAKKGLRHLEGKVMKEKGYTVDPVHPENVKYEVASDLGIPLSQGYNGNLTAKDAGKVGGTIGGPMVKEMIKMAQQSMFRKK